MEYLSIEIFIVTYKNYKTIVKLVNLCVIIYRFGICTLKLYHISRIMYFKHYIIE